MSPHTYWVDCRQNAADTLSITNANVCVDDFCEQNGVISCTLPVQQKILSSSIIIRELQRLQLHTTFPYTCIIIIRMLGQTLLLGPTDASMCRAEMERWLDIACEHHSSSPHERHH